MIFRSPFPEIVIPAVPLAKLVLGQAAGRASKPALIDAETGRMLGYGQLADLVERVAGGLRRLGLRKGDVLATLCPICRSSRRSFWRWLMRVGSAPR